MSAVTQYDENVQSALASYARIRKHKNGRWIAELEPTMLNPLIAQALPPGQAIWLGQDGLETGFDGDTRFVNGIEHYDAAENMWASIPRFESSESALKMLMHWINNNRADLVSAAIAEETYRRTTASKAAYPAVKT